MKGYVGKSIFIFSCIFLLGSIFVTLSAQNITDLPPNQSNDRFFEDQLVNQRPALSIVGFRGNDLSDGYSFEQILNRVYDQNSYSDKALIRRVFNNIALEAIPSNINNPNNSDGSKNRTVVERNSRVLQNLGFVALASYTLDQNNINPQSPPAGVEPLPSASQAMSDLKSALLTLVNQYGVLAQPSGDEVKRPRSLENIARAIDLYLALENAYRYYNNITNWSTASAPELLSANQKSALFNLFEDNINSLEADITANEAPTVQRDEVEPGNAPLKVYSALGLASMSMQQSSTNSFSDFTWLLNKSIGRAGDFANNNERKHYWNYQTDTGKEFWAEGPYYMQYALSSVVPFWHAVRANGHLSKLSHGQDPFNSSWFTDPLIWLSKITMPGGYTPPLDDGNKHEISTASVLRWQSVYGNSSVGKRFSWVAKQINSTNNGVGLNNNLYLVELAIPRTAQDILPPSSYGNSQPSQTGENGKQQAIIRRANNRYLLLNGESGDAITRGEGHEQGDNMQLLYNVGNLSYLMDSGYDRVETEKGLWNWIKGDTWAKSSWNNYRDHNVTIGFPPFLDVKDGYENSGELDAGGFFGGIQPPDLDGTRVHSNHYSTEELYLRSEGQIDILNGKTSLFTYDREGRKYEFGDYRRRAIFINDGSDSYLIDLNMVETDGGVTGNGNWLLHSYHINSQTLKYSPENDGFALFQNIDQQSNKHLFLYPSRVERDAVSEGAVSIFDDIAEEEHRDTKSIKRLDIWAGYGFDPRLSRFHTTVSFIKPLSISDQDLNNKSEHFSELPTPLFDGSLDDLEDRSHQAWYWQKDANTVDVIVKRSKVDMTRYNQKIDFSINENGISIQNIRLPAGKDYGFARLEQNNGIWQINSDYQINIERFISPPQNVQITNADDGDGGDGDGGGPGDPPDPLSIGGPAELNWDDHSAANFDHYEVYRQKKRVSDGYLYNKKLIASPSGSSYTDSEIVMGSGYPYDYTYAVKAVTTNDIRSDFSNATQWVNATAPYKSIAKEEEENLPENFMLDHNYPNPFNPSTTIKYGVPEQADVNLQVYNILGQRVAGLVNESQTAGFYEVNFGSSKLASGMYIARIVATGESGEQFVKELKMQLIK